MLPIANYTPEGELKVNLYPYNKTLTRLKVRETASQSIPNASDTAIEFNVVDYDTLGEWDTTNDKFVPQESGFYHFSCQFLLSSSSNWNSWSEVIYTRFVVNGSAVQIIGRDHWNTGGAGSYANTQGSATLFLNAGDEVQISIYQSSGGAITLFSASTYNFLSIERVPHNATVIDGIGSLNHIESYVATGSVSSIEFTGIPGTYRHLFLVTELRSDVAAEAEAVYIHFNGDEPTTTNYDAVTGTINGAGTSSGGATRAGQNSWFGVAHSANGRASNFDASYGYIYGYATTDREKQWYSAAHYLGDSSADTDHAIRFGAGRWRDTSAIISFKLTTSGGNNFVVGSKISLYGVS